MYSIVCNKKGTVNRDWQDASLIDAGGGIRPVRIRFASIPNSDSLLLTVDATAQAKETTTVPVAREGRKIDSTWKMGSTIYVKASSLACLLEPSLTGAAIANRIGCAASNICRITKQVKEAMDARQGDIYLIKIKEPLFKAIVSAATALTGKEESHA
jgi:hypothetical protein